MLSIIEWWSERSPWLRYGLAIGLLLLSTALYVGGTFWPWGWGLGVVLLLASGRSEAERKGYRL
jgi:hypothetical protein